MEPLMPPLEAIGEEPIPHLRDRRLFGRAVIRFVRDWEDTFHAAA